MNLIFFRQLYLLQTRTFWPKCGTRCVSATGRFKLLHNDRFRQTTTDNAYGDSTLGSGDYVKKRQIACSLI